MTVVTGSASSGKSSLITTAFEQNEDAICINQKPVHASNRSNLCTYLDIFDEPTTGLHEDDLPILIECFNHLIDEGNTVILIEHNLTMMTEADGLLTLDHLLVNMEDNYCMLENLKDS
ncbi:excinuclease UvrABC ATPase subunit [Staphylococcus hominis]